MVAAPDTRFVPSQGEPHLTDKTNEYKVRPMTNGKTPTKSGYYDVVAVFFVAFLILSNIAATQLIDGLRSLIVLDDVRIDLKHSWPAMRRSMCSC